jgi:hypothetical protein
MNFDQLNEWDRRAQEAQARAAHARSLTARRASPP